MDTLTSADGTPIAYERLGDGPPLIVVGGALCDRGRMRPVCAALGAHVTVFNYDRRGRGDSGEGVGHDVEREIEDLAALVAEAGGRAAVYGHSSGAALVLRAALRGPALRPASSSTTRRSRPTATRVARRPGRTTTELRALVAAGRDGDAVALFMRLTGVPPDAVEAMRGEPWFAATTALGPSLVHDSAAMGNAERGATVPLDLIAAAQPTFRHARPRRRRQPAVLPRRRRAASPRRCPTRACRCSRARATSSTPRRSPRSWPTSSPPSG